MAASASNTSIAPSPAKGEALVDEIHADIACPSCGYNLRGLHGPIVDCPECGGRCDVARLISRKWTKPWYQAPRFNTLLMPACAAMALVFCLLVFAGRFPAGLGPLGTMTSVRQLGVIGFIIAAAIVWLGLMRQAWKVFESFRGVGLAMLAHVLVVGYLVGIWGGVAATTALVILLGDRHWPQALLAAMGLALAAVLVWGCRRGEKFIAEQCIRRYLQTAPPPDDH